MAEITCVNCGRNRNITNSGHERPHGWKNTDVIRGVLICRGPINVKSFGEGEPCKGRTVFELTGNSVTFAPGKLYEGDLRRDVPTEASEYFSEAVLCFYGTAYKGVVAMCRSSVEAALDHKGAKGADLKKKIIYAKDKLKILGDEEVSQAQGARLIGRDAIHRGLEVTQTQALISLGATLDLVNHINESSPAPVP